MSHVALALRGH